MNRMDRRFKTLKQNGKKAFIAFITAGYPDLSVTEKLILEFDRIGVDIIELGIPFSDPMADGPVIQDASHEALQAGVTLAKVLQLVKRVRRKSDVPIAFMTYYNPVFCFGDSRFLDQARAAGVDGVIIPDLPPEEATVFMRQAAARDVRVICFVAPTTSTRRLRYISSVAQGFLYYVSLTGVTGERRRLSQDLVKNIRAVKRSTTVPVCVGFGVSTAAQVRQVQRYADGVIVGSAIVKKIKENKARPDLVRRVSAFVAALKG